MNASETEIATSSAIVELANRFMPDTLEIDRVLVLRLMRVAYLRGLRDCARVALSAAAPDTTQNVAQVVINGHAFSSQETADWLINQIRDTVSRRPDFVRSKDQPMAQAQMALGVFVEILCSNEGGQVIARAEYLNSETQYLVRYKAADGRAVESWWAESALEQIGAER